MFICTHMSHLNTGASEPTGRPQPGAPITLGAHGRRPHGAIVATREQSFAHTRCAAHVAGE